MKISVIIPVKDQTEKLLKNLKEAIIPYFDKAGVAYDILICSDHSSLGQEKLLEEGLKAFPAQVRHLPYEDVKGKGFAVRKAILASDCDYDLFMDADLATDLSIFDLMKKDLGKYDAYIASRNVKGSSYVRRQKPIRRLTHFGARKITCRKLHLKQVHDTQCGFKMFRDDVAKEMARRQITNLGAFDAEYLYFLELNGFRVKEYPARWRDDPDSTISSPVKESIAFYKSLKQIKKNRKAYILTPEEKALLQKGR
jgi:dolichyl-phosphate beta-glucosyltransferase